MKRNVLLILYVICWLTGLCQISFGQQPEFVVQIGHVGDISSIVFSADGKLLASGSHDTTIKLWDVATGNELQTLPKQNDAIFSVIFSPDGKTLASRSRKGALKLWNPLSGQEIKILSEGGNSQFGINLGEYAALMERVIVFPQSKLLTFSTDGKTLASESPDKSLKLWDVASGKELRTFQPDDPNKVREVFAVINTLMKVITLTSLCQMWLMSARPWRSSRPNFVRISNSNNILGRKL